ncbi:hypothetical protein WUBG_04451 [Wuchereria bancrofti]|uniref:Uncharacterized protein n=1 Tax=Wuchereria bancrofti TaxID=6293 RepID=J9ER33_WUCBA|nr:hypothetical protein WUBG_04451 [Wuchereria bancrofti]
MARESKKRKVVRDNDVKWKGRREERGRRGIREQASSFLLVEGIVTCTTCSHIATAAGEECMMAREGKTDCVARWLVVRIIIISSSSSGSRRTGRAARMHCHNPIYVTAFQEYLKIKVQKTDKCNNESEGTDKWVNLALEMKDAILASTTLHGEVKLRNDFL